MSKQWKHISSLNFLSTDCDFVNRQGLGPRLYKVGFLCVIVLLFSFCCLASLPSLFFRLIIRGFGETQTKLKRVLVAIWSSIHCHQGYCGEICASRTFFPSLVLWRWTKTLIYKISRQRQLDSKYTKFWLNARTKRRKIHIGETFGNKMQFENVKFIVVASVFVLRSVQPH